MKNLIISILYKLGVCKVLPISFVNAVTIKENNEKLVNIKNIKGFLFVDELSNRREVLLRHTVVEMLKQASQALPKNYYIMIDSAYRPILEQKKLWEFTYKNAKRDNPNLTDKALLKMVNALCVNPNVGFGGHQTGGAVDVILCDKNGVEYDMGEPTQTGAKNITAKQSENRQILSKAMESAGFKNYPYEWWHFCYGDRMWAAYSNKKVAFYGYYDDKRKTFS